MTGPIDSKSPLCIALADLLPALRWGDPRRLGPLMEDPRLPGTWWNDTSLVDVTATIGAEEVAHRAAQALRAYWPHLTLGVALPNLCFCPEGQETDLRVTIEQAASDVGVEEEDEAVARLVRPLLRPFLIGGRNLMEPTATASRAESPAEPNLDIHALANMLARLLPADTPSAIRAAVDSLRAWDQGRSEKESSTPDSDTKEQVEATSGRKAGPTAAPALLEEPLNALESLISDWGERQLAVAAGRTFGQNRISLENLGEQFGVSRERARQIQVELEKKLQLWLHSDSGRPFLSHLLAVQDLLGPVATEAELRQLHPGHELTVPALGLPLWQLTASLLPDRTWTSGWLVEGNLDERIEQTRAELTRLCGESAPTWAEAVELLRQLGIHETAAEEWLLVVKGFRVTEGHLLPWGRSVNDRAEAVLMLVGRPLAMEDLLTRLDDGTALASLRNQIQSDDRFMRRDRDLYGLRRWGGVEYLGIREMIIRELESAGGEAKSEDIVTTLCSQFDVSDRSVRAYLAAPEFERFKRGWVRVAAHTETGTADYQPRRDVAQTRRCFQTGQGTWWYRLDVNGEHLRGSGFTIPAGFAAHLGLAPGGRLELSHDVGDIQLVWRNQPTCGSLRPLLETMGAVEGDHVFVAAKDGHLKALRLAEEPGTNLTDTQRALRLMALSGQVTEKDMPAVLGRRIGLADATTMDEVLAHLRVRGDKDILELLREQYELSGATAPDEEPSVPATPEGELSSAAPPQHSPSDPQPTGDTAAEAKQSPKPEFRDPAWDEEIIPLLDEDSEADLIHLAQAVASRGKTVPVFGFELGEGGWQADFAWNQDTAKVAVVPAVQHGRVDPEAERRDAAYRAAGWTIRSAVDWLAHLDELLVLLPDATPGN
ncbi:uncharacterized protein SAZU_0823 [Streptomyces azureus]|uniref:RNA polymerase sigma-70 region 4 domain-containing protein n=2 Tax=Streptomyces azureus TaxID=146537 RepID=A0A0K8PEB5_STRAJ|nr:uncharacterized protein SAZU_0823 [Streptomyces azureus]